VGSVGCNNQFYHMLVGDVVHQIQTGVHWRLDRSTVALTLFLSALMYSNPTGVDHLATI